MKKLLYIIVLLVLCLASCKTEKVITEVVEVPRVSIVEKHDTLTDSVYQHDSIIVFQRGDTVYKETIRYKYRDKVLKKNSNTTDTITKVQKIPIPYEVEKKLTKIQKAEIALGKALILILALTGVGGLAYLFIKRKL